MNLDTTKFLTTCFLLFNFTIAFAQTNTWNGGAGDWHDIGSWSLNHVPLPTEDVVIPAGGDVTVTNSITPATALTIFVNGNAILTTKSGTSISMVNAGATTNKLRNSGEIFNQGTIVLSNNGIGNHVIQNFGNSTIFVNEGMIDVNGYEGSNIHGIVNSGGATFTNKMGGDINISDGNNTSSGSGIHNTGGGSKIENLGNVVISNVRNGITNNLDATFDNDSDLYLGDVKWDAGIENQTGATFHNKSNGYITLEELNDVAGIEGIYNSAIFINDGDLEIISPSGEGIENRTIPGYFGNNGTIDIGGSASTYGIVNSSSATWAGTGDISTNKPFFQNWIWTTLGPESVPFIGSLNLTGNAKDTLVINGAATINYNTINVTGDLNLDGTLVIKTTNGFMPGIIDQFTLFTCNGTISGAFSSLILPAGFEDFEISVLNGQVTLKNPNCVQLTNTWTGGYGGKWSVDSNWDLGHVPTICEKVIISSGDSVEMNEGEFFIKEMELNGVLNIVSNDAILEINGQGDSDTGIDMAFGKLINQGTVHIFNQYGVLNAGGINCFGGEIYNSGVIQIEDINKDGNGYFSSAFYVQNGFLVNEMNGLIKINNVNIASMRLQGSALNEGTIEISNGLDGLGLWNLDSFTNGSTGHIEITNMEELAISTGPEFINEGTILISQIDASGMGTSPGGIFKNNGLVDISNIPIADISVASGSIISGNGTFELENLMSVQGILNPGNSPGKLTINGRIDHTPTAIDTFEIAGLAGPGLSNGHDQIVIDDILVLSGKMVIKFLNGYLPNPFDEFVLFEYSGSLAGTFSQVELPDAISNWIIDYSIPNQIILKYPSCLIATNEWVGGNSSWNTPANWNLGHVPTACEYVRIENNSNVTLPSGNSGYALSIFIEDGSTFLVDVNANLNINMGAIQFNHGIHNEGSVVNDGAISIRNSESSYGIFNAFSGQFTNNGNISIEDLNNTNSVGILTIGNGTFTNETTGQIFISDMEFVSSSSFGASSGGTFINKGIINVVNGGSISVNTNSIIENFGTIISDTVQAAQFINFATGSLFHNHAGAQLTLTNSLQNGNNSNGILGQSNAPIFINDGDIDIDNVGKHGLWFTSGSTFINTGTVDISNTGLLSATGKDGFFDGATYKGDNGELYGSNELFMNGVFSPGNSPGYLYFENTLVLSSSNVDSVEIGGTSNTQYDYVEILDGDLVVGGLIDIKLIDGFIPADSDIFTLYSVSGGTISGNFSFVIKPPALTGWELDFSVAGKIRLIKPACTSATNSWVGTSPNFEPWTDGSKWSLGHKPRYCEDVIIGAGKKVVIDDVVFAVAHSIEINGGSLHVNPIGFLNIDVNQSAKTGLYNRNGGNFTNYGDVNIFDTNGFNADGILNDASSTILNGLSSELNIYNIAGGNADGMFNIGTFTNDGEINIHNVVNANGLISSLNGSSFTNNGSIHVYDINFWGISVLSSAIFTQTDNGTMLIEDCGSFRFRTTSNANVDLDGTVTLE